MAGAVVASVRELSADFQTTGVVVPGPRLDSIFRALESAGLEPVDTSRSQSLGAALSVVDAAVVKGLEFDAVIVVEPGDFPGLHADPLTGLRLLYVALTRAVQRLTIVHSRPFPEPLRVS